MAGPMHQPTLIQSSQAHHPTPATQAGTQGPRPPIYFCEQGAAAVRLALCSPPVAAKGQKAFSQGGSLKAEGKRPIVALCGHPTEGGLLLVLTADGQLTG